MEETVLRFALLTCATMLGLIPVGIVLGAVIAIVIDKIRMWQLNRDKPEDSILL